MQSVLIVMSIMGSTGLLLSWLISPIGNKYFSSRWRYHLLKINMTIFLLPLPLVKNYIIDFIQVFNSDFFIHNRSPNWVPIERVIQISSNEQLVLPMRPIMLIMLVTIWILGVITILTCQIYSYIKMRQSIFTHSRGVTDLGTTTLLEELKVKLGIKKNVAVVISEKSDSPFTIGLFSPIIILPNRTINTEQMQYILKHELVHIRQSDFWVRVVGVLILSLHWFNPFAHLLFKEIDRSSEFCCDEQVVINLNYNQRIMYGNTVLEMACDETIHSKMSTRFINSIGFGSKKNMKERLTLIKLPKKKSLGAFILSGVLAVSIASTSLLTVFAYSNLVILEGEKIKDNTSENIDMVFHNVEKPLEKDTKVQLVTKANAYRLDDESATHDISGFIELSEKVICSHVYYDGDYLKHTSYSNRSCKLDNYHAKYCERCDKCVLGSKYYTERESICPH